MINDINAGQIDLFKEIVEMNKRLVYHVVSRMESNAAVREDLCQDVFLKVYKNINSFKFESKLSSWIAKIAYNTCISHIEKKKIPLFDDNSPEEFTIDDLEIDGREPYQIVEDNDVSDLIRSEIEMLPMQFKVILVLYHIESMGYEEISEVLELPVGTVSSYVYRARKLLKERLLNKYNKEDVA
ncbi:MAG: sigma-70 family RNA polymerase sigma factor [bacterium]|nr:sigma-70 family RNA polymerase sigma factor [bacterium]